MYRIISICKRRNCLELECLATGKRCFHKPYHDVCIYNLGSRVCLNRGA